MFNSGAFGGAAKRYTQLYIELIKKYPQSVYLFVNNHLYTQIKEIFPGISTKNIRIVDITKAAQQSTVKNKSTFYADNSPDPMEIDKNTPLLRKIFWYYKNLFRQKKLFNIIENYRRELNIKVFVGVFSGGLPLIFYTVKKPRKASVIFANMDSWFSDVHADMKKLWYRKYYSFNDIMESADYVDFLSPYILEGVKKRKVNIKDEAVAIAPCSFIDYSKCGIGDKSSFEIAFSARLEPDKNPMMFLEAAKIIHGKYPDVKFHIMGEGTLVNEVEEFIGRNTLRDVIDFRFHKNPPEVFAGTSIFVSLQSGTNYPSQSVLEAMACGNGIIASNTGDTNLFINENNGLLLNLSVSELVSAIEKSINDKELTHKLGANARDYAISNHTAEKYVNYFTGLVNKAYKKNFT
jgi:glycosyltransferase involved in cell wall biosynthesis